MGFARYFLPLNRAWLALRALVIAVAFTSCASMDPNAVDPRDHAIDTIFPPPNAIAVAENRARNWWQRYQQRFGNQPPYLAVQATFLLQGDIVQNLYAKLLRSQTTSSFFAHGLEQAPQLEAYSVMIYDTRTGHVVSPEGYVVVDTPPRGSVTRFGPYIARYISTGN